MTRTRTATTALELLAAVGLQYGLSRLLGRTATYAEEREQHDLSGRVPTQRVPADGAASV